MLLSIIIPIYNTEKYLFACLNSVLDLNLIKDYEVIMINDGSTDGSQKICEQFESKYNNFHLLNQKNAGVSCARNNAVKIAKGEYVLFVDADDRININGVKTIIENIRANKVDLYIYSYSQIYSNGEKKKCNIQKNICFNMTDKDKVCALFIGGQAPWRKVYKRSLIIDNEVAFPTDISHGEDGLFNCRYLEHCNTYAIFDEIIYQHYIRENTLSTTPNIGYLNDINFVYSEEVSFVKKYGSKEDLYRLDNYFLHFLVLAIRLHYKVKEFRKILKKTKIYNNLICSKVDYGKISFCERVKVTIKKIVIKFNLVFLYKIF